MTWDGKKTLCVDFDGVIHLFEGEWKGLHIIEDNPHPDAFKALEQYLTRFHVHIYSARSASPEGIAAMKDWFRKHGCNEETIEKLQFSEKKPSASVYLDDRGWRFTGDFPTVDQLYNFVPWNRKK